MPAVLRGRMVACIAGLASCLLLAAIHVSSRGAPVVQEENFLGFHRVGNYDYDPADESGYRQLGTEYARHDWTRYPYTDPVFRDGQGPFSTVMSEGSQGVTNVTDKYSYWWKVPNNMGYPNKELDARLTWPFDQRVGGRSYNTFWGGSDSIAQQKAKAAAWFADEEESKPSNSAESGDYEAFWGAKEQDNGYLDDPDGREWAGLPADLGHGMGGAINAEDTEGGGGLVKVFRRSYSGDKYRAFDDHSWQSEGALPQTATEGVPEDYPRQLYHYGVKGTDEDLDGVEGDMERDEEAENGPKSERGFVKFD